MPPFSLSDYSVIRSAKARNGHNEFVKETVILSLAPVFFALKHFPNLPPSLRLLPPDKSPCRARSTSTGPGRPRKWCLCRCGGGQRAAWELKPNPFGSLANLIGCSSGTPHDFHQDSQAIGVVSGDLSRARAKAQRFSAPRRWSSFTSYRYYSHSVGHPPSIFADNWADANSRNSPRIASQRKLQDSNMIFFRYASLRK